MHTAHKLRLRDNDVLDCAVDHQEDQRACSGSIKQLRAT